MKKIISKFILITLFFTHTALAGFYGMNSTGVSLKNSLLAHWKLNDNAANTTVVDSTGSYNMTAAANTSTYTTTGIVGQSFDINGGAGRRASIADPVGLRLDNWSVSYWIYYERTSNVTSTFFKEAETYPDAVGTNTTYLTRTCRQVLASSGAGYVMTYPISTTTGYEKGAINFWCDMAIPTKPGVNTLIARHEIWDNNTSSIVQSVDVYSNSFAAGATWYAGYQCGTTIGRWLPGTDNYSLRVYSYGNVDFYLDKDAFDIYHNSPLGKGAGWGIWANGTQFRVDTTQPAQKTVDGGAPTYLGWTHYVCTYDRTNQQIKIYRNGVNTGTTSLGGDYPVNWASYTGYPIYIGAKGTGANDQMCGRVDNVMFFNKVLTPNEAMFLYNVGTATETIA